MNLNLRKLSGSMLCFMLALTLYGFATTTLASTDDDLLSAAKSGNVKEVGRLLNEGADVNIMDKGGNTSLHAAALDGYKDVDELLAAKEAEIDAKRKGDATYTVSQGCKDVARLLIAKGTI